MSNGSPRFPDKVPPIQGAPTESANIPLSQGPLGPPPAPADGGISDAPADNGLYARQNNAWVAVAAQSSSDILTDCEDFLYEDFGPSAKWTVVNGTPDLVEWQTDHPGILSLPSLGNFCDLVMNHRVYPDLRTVVKTVARFIVSWDRLLDPNDELEAVIGLTDLNTATTPDVESGALFSYAPFYNAANFPAVNVNALIIGTYGPTIGATTDQPTSLIIAANTWYDLILSMTPATVKFYGGIYTRGSLPPLIGQIIDPTKINLDGAMIWLGNHTNGSIISHTYVDRVEWAYQTTFNQIRLGEALMAL